MSGPEGDQTKIEVGGLTMPKPVTWVWTVPSMQFRALQYAVPAEGVNSPAAELVFSVFPAGDGGPVDANLERWAGQFRDGANAAASKRSESTVDPTEGDVAATPKERSMISALRSLTSSIDP